MALIEVRTTATGTEAADVLFVTNQQSIPSRLVQHLEEKGYVWAKVAVSVFTGLIDELRSTGTVVIDTTEIEEPQRNGFLQALRKLEQYHIAAIFLNNEIDFPFAEYKLATMLQSASLEEIVGRIETNVAYHKNLSLARIAPAADTAETLPPDTIEQLKMAGEVQRSFLPRRLPNSDLLRWSVMFRPADWVSGDIYDIARLDEQHIGFYIADAVGHSLPAALLTMFLKHAIILRETRGKEYRIFAPTDVIREANDRMAAQELKGCLFATCCYGLLNFRTMQLTFARAGHPYPILIRPGQAPIQLESRGGLLGVFGQADFQQRSMQLASGDRLLFYSDGCESLIGGCNEDGHFEFSDQFMAIADLDVEEMIERLDHLAAGRNIPHSERDDMTAIGLQIL
ncbi:MAG: serine/threonine-protein phosphatase [Sedimentisphaerales bacterium]|nr:serine/threonine-protein phosphatase [Sedimentisphaerales bacterium]